MKRFATIVSCVCLMSFGWFLGTHDDTAIHATDPPTLNFNIPVDFQASLLKKIVGSLTQELKDNVRVDTVRVTETKHVQVRVPYRVVERDTSYVPILLVITPQVRKEHYLETESADDSIKVSKDDTCSRDSTDTFV